MSKTLFPPISQGSTPNHSQTIDLSNSLKYNRYSYKTLEKSTQLRKNFNQKSAVVRSIDTYHHTSNVLDILGKNQDNYPKELDEEEKIDISHEVSGNLQSLRKGYDFVRCESMELEKQIQQMRSEIEVMKIQEKNFYEIGGSEEDRFKYLQKLYDDTEQELIDHEMVRGTYQHLLGRLKKDLIIFQLKAKGIHQALDVGKNVEKQALERYQKIKQSHMKAQEALEDVINTIENDHKKREKNINQFKGEIEQKQDVEKQREERNKRQQEIAEFAANDVRDLNIKKWKKLCLVHQFLKTFLKDKMNREMKKFSQIEESFLQIKAATGISDAGEIVNKFLNREQTYSHLLISISNYEKKIEVLKKQNEDLKERLQELNYQSVPMERLETKLFNPELENAKEEYQKISEKAEFIRMTEERVHSWLIRYLIKLERAIGIEKSIEQYYSEYDKSKSSQLLERISFILRQNLLTQLPEEVNKSITDYLKNQTFEDQSMIDYVKRNVRINPPISRRGEYSMIKDKTEVSFKEGMSQDYSEGIQDDIKADSENEQIQADEKNYIKQLKQEVKNKIPNNHHKK